jgi:hypothetical protein
LLVSENELTHNSSNDTVTINAAKSALGQKKSFTFAFPQESLD